MRTKFFFFSLFQDFHQGPRSLAALIYEGNGSNGKAKKGASNEEDDGDSFFQLVGEEQDDLGYGLDEVDSSLASLRLQSRTPGRSISGELCTTNDGNGSSNLFDNGDSEDDDGGEEGEGSDSDEEENSDAGGEVDGMDVERNVNDQGDDYEDDMSEDDDDNGEDEDEDREEILRSCFVPFDDDFNAEEGNAHTVSVNCYFACLILF